MLRVWGRTNSLNVQKVMWGSASSASPTSVSMPAAPSAGWIRRTMAGRTRTAWCRRSRTTASCCGNRMPASAIWRRRYGAGSLWPEDPGERGRSDRFMDWMITTVLPPLGFCFMQLVRTPAEKRDRTAVDAAAERLGPIWSILDDHLSDKPFVGGEQLTIGDIPLGCAFYRYQNIDVARPSLPNCQLWYQGLKKREPYRRHVMLPVT